MVSREIIHGIHWVGAIDFDRRIFDELIPLPNGTSYNSYLVQGSEKTALIDTVDPTKEFELISNLVKLNVDRIDYVVVNHAEQDHSGSLPMILEFFPDAISSDQREVQRPSYRPSPPAAKPFQGNQRQRNPVAGRPHPRIFPHPVDTLARDPDYLPA